MKKITFPREIANKIIRMKRMGSSLRQIREELGKKYSVETIRKYLVKREKERSEKVLKRMMRVLREKIEDSVIKLNYHKGIKEIEYVRDTVWRASFMREFMDRSDDPFNECDCAAYEEVMRVIGLADMLRPNREQLRWIGLSETELLQFCMDAISKAANEEILASFEGNPNEEDGREKIAPKLRKSVVFKKESAPPSEPPRPQPLPSDTVKFFNYWLKLKKKGDRSNLA